MSRSAGKLEGKVALITGGNSGIGFATAELFIAEGARVIITGRRADAVADAVARLGPQAHGIPADVASLAALDTMYREVSDLFGEIDILFANAGVGKFCSTQDNTEEMFDEVFNINCKGLFFTVAKGIPLLREGGSILVNSSAIWPKAAPNFSVYAATKAAARSFVRSWALELKDRRIRVNCISPGPIETPIFGKVDPGHIADVSSLIDKVPLGRIGKPEEVAQAALFLAVDGTYITGIDLLVDGGFVQA